jgi:hypothetical protein
VKYEVRASKPRPMSAKAMLRQQPRSFRMADNALGITIVNIVGLWCREVQNGQVTDSAACGRGCSQRWLAADSSLGRCRRAWKGEPRKARLLAVNNPRLLIDDYSGSSYSPSTS